MWTQPTATPWDTATSARPTSTRPSFSLCTCNHGLRCVLQREGTFAPMSASSWAWQLPHADTRCRFRHDAGPVLLGVAQQPGRLGDRGGAIHPPWPWGICCHGIFLQALGCLRIGTGRFLFSWASCGQHLKKILPRCSPRPFWWKGGLLCFWSAVLNGVLEQLQTYGQVVGIIRVHLGGHKVVNLRPANPVSNIKS